MPTDLPTLIRSHARWRFIFLGLALVVPLLLEAAFAGRIERVHLLAVFAFFAANAAVCQLKLGKLRERAVSGGLGPLYVVSPVWLGRVVAVILLAVLLSVSFAPEVRAVQEKAFGAAPFGLPVIVVVDVCTVLLFAPYFWVMDHAARIVVQAQKDGASLSKLGMVVYLFGVGRRHPELVRSRNVVLGGLGWFFLLLGLWIAYTDARGI